MEKAFEYLLIVSDLIESVSTSLATAVEDDVRATGDRTQANVLMVSEDWQEWIDSLSDAAAGIRDTVSAAKLIRALEAAGAAEVQA